MGTCMKKRNIIIRLVSILVSVLCLMMSFYVLAGAVKVPEVSTSKPIITYTYNSSGKIYAYKDSSLKTKTGGYIDCPNDECEIIDIKGNAVKVRYPVSGGTKTAWFSRESFTYRDLKNDGAKFSFKAKASVNVYRWKGKTTKLGNVVQNDTCYLLRGDENSDWLQVIYPVSGAYKMGWIKKADYLKILPVAESVKLNKSTVVLNAIGASTTFKATVYPDTAIDKTVKWSSSNTAVATVSSAGVVTAKKNGTAVITATASNGKKATGEVVVKVTVPVTSVTLNKKSLTLTKQAETSTLTATVQPSNATDKKITWSSSNTAVATVSSAGVVTAKKNGTAVITATTSNGKKATAEVVVNVTVPVTSVTLNKKSLTLTKQAETSTLTATVQPSNATDKKITWSSSNTAVATVSSAGVVTAKKNGTAVITATASNSKKATVDVKVVFEEKETDIPVESVTLDRIEVVLTEEGDTYSFTANIFPVNATNKKITWSSSNAAVATVSSTGVVTAKKNGTAVITATTSKGKKATADVTVKFEETEKEVPVTSIELDKSSIILTGVNSTAVINADVYPSNATDKTIKWKTTDSSVAKLQVSGNKYRFTALKIGTTTYTAIASNGKSASITVKVVEQKATGITLNKKAITLNGKGKTVTLSASVKPDNTTDKSVKWESSNKNIATVSSAGKVTAVNNGTVNITAKTSNGKTAVCKVTVSAVKAKSVELNKTSISLSVGDTHTIKATVSPSNSTDEVTYTSSDKKIATVSSSGKITAKKAGVCTIAAKTTSGKTAKVKVTVTGNYVAYSGLDYTSLLDKALSKGEISKKEYKNRISVLNKAQKMVTVVWTSPLSFHTWKGGSGSYNSNKKMLYSGKANSNYMFVKGCKYVGIPYAANAGNNKYDDLKWLDLITKKDVKKSKLEGKVNYLSINRNNCTFRGVDCSGFVYMAYSELDSYNLEYLSTAGLLSSSSWKKTSAKKALPGDILLKSGHVMIFVGKTANGKIAVMESVADGKKGYSGSRYYTFNSVSSYSYYRYSKIAK